MPAGELQDSCPGADGHGRTRTLAKTVIHDAWRARRDLEKFDRVLDFARSLPRLRRAVEREIVLDGLPRERVLACAARLLDVGLFRIGGEEYAAENGSVGLATLERRHVRLEPGDTVAFCYQAKGRRPRRLRVARGEPLARQYTGRLQALVHRPTRLRPVPRRARDHRPAGGARRAGGVPAARGRASRAQAPLQLTRALRSWSAPGALVLPAHPAEAPGCALPRRSPPLRRAARVRPATTRSA
jgi:Eukaryotic DNA topoisomerase I, catalytic core